MWDLGGELLAVAAIVARTTGESVPAGDWERLLAARGPSGEVPWTAGTWTRSAPRPARTATATSCTTTTPPSWPPSRRSWPEPARLPSGPRRPRRGGGPADKERRHDRPRLVHTVGVGALEWLWAHRDGFRLEPDVDPEVGFLERFKPVGELALVCKVLFREGVAGSRQAELARRLLDHVWRETLDGGTMLVRGQHTEPASRSPSRCTCRSTNSATATPSWSAT